LRNAAIHAHGLPDGAGERNSHNLRDRRALGVPGDAGPGRVRRVRWLCGGLRAAVRMPGVGARDHPAAGPGDVHACRVRDGAVSMLGDGLPAGSADLFGAGLQVRDGDGVASGHLLHLRATAIRRCQAGVRLSLCSGKPHAACYGDGSVPGAASDPSAGVQVGGPDGHRAGLQQLLPGSSALLPLRIDQRSSFRLPEKHQATEFVPPVRSGHRSPLRNQVMTIDVVRCEKTAWPVEKSYM